MATMGMVWEHTSPPPSGVAWASGRGTGCTPAPVRGHFLEQLGPEESAVSVSLWLRPTG